MKKKITYLIAYFFLILITTEILSRIFLNSNNQQNVAYNRYMLFEENDIFKNYENFYIYYPNKKILSETYYDVDNKFIKEYSYFIKTNNLGLVQDNDLIKNKKSILFLGDSFTGGQGYNAWINNFKGSYKDLQVVNGGIIGTGPIDFYILENHLSNILDINKVVFIYIGDDYIRTPPIIPESTQKCLKNQDSCVGNENFYGFKNNNIQEVNLYLDKLKKYRIQNKNNIFETYNLLEVVINKIKSFLKKSNLVVILDNFLDNYRNKKIFKKNFYYTKELIKKYNNNIIFVRLNTKQEILLGKKSFWSNKIEKEFSKINIKNYYCSFNNDLKLFYENDGHPNKLGYNYLYNCILDILNK